MLSNEVVVGRLRKYLACEYEYHDYRIATVKVLMNLRATWHCLLAIGLAYQWLRITLAPSRLDTAGFG
jgi:hypothetical protein